MNLELINPLELPQSIFDIPQFKEFLDEELERKHPCSILDETLKKIQLLPPKYEFISQEINRKQEIEFTCQCQIEELAAYYHGKGKNKKVAKSMAAKEAIIALAALPDVQKVLISIMMSANMNDTFLLGGLSGGPSKKRAKRSQDQIFLPQNFNTNFPQISTHQKTAVPFQIQSTTSSDLFENNFSLSQQNQLTIPQSQNVSTLQASNSRINKQAADRFIFNHLGTSKHEMTAQNQKQQEKPIISQSSHRTVTQALTHSKPQEELCTNEDLEKAEQIKLIFKKIQEWADQKKQKYVFQDAPCDTQGWFKKQLYFENDLLGVGEATTQRKAKILCAKQALENLEAGKVMPKPCSKNGLIEFLRQKNDLKSMLISDPDEQIAQQQQYYEQQKKLEEELEEQKRQEEQELEKRKKREEKEHQRLQQLQQKNDEKKKQKEEKRKLKELKIQEKLMEKERKRQAKIQEKREIAIQKYTVSLEEQGMFEAYVLLRSTELQLLMEDQYDFVKFILKIQELKPKLEEIGILNIIPVGSATNKTIRRDYFMMDIIMNYNKTIITHDENKVLQNPDQQRRLFDNIIENLSTIIKQEFTSPNYFVSSGQLYIENQGKPIYEVFSDTSGDGIESPYLAQVKLINTIDQTKLNARFFVQELHQHDTFYSIKHWFDMQRTLREDVKFHAVQRVLKQWRFFHDLANFLYPEVLDSVLLMCVKNKESLDDCLGASIVSISWEF
eukprot:403345443